MSINAYYYSQQLVAARIMYYNLDNDSSNVIN